MGKINKRRPDLNKLNGSARGNLMSAKEAINETKKLGTISDYALYDIPASKLEPMSYNSKFYSLEDFDFLGATIKQFGLLQPIIVWKQSDNDKYWIVAGERRYQSYLKMLEDEKVAAMYPKGLPCHVFPETMSIIEIKMILIITNATARVRNQETQINELKELIELFKQAEENGIYIGFTFKELVMSRLQVSERQYQKYISALSVIPELAEHAEKAKADLNLTSAIGAKPVEVQEEILERVQAGEDISKAYQDVNTQYKEYKKEGKEISETISALRDQVAEIESQDDIDPKEQEEKIQELKAEIKEQREKKKAHKENVKEAIKKKERSVELSEKKNEANSVRLPEKPAEPEKHDPRTLNDLLIPTDDAMVYIEKSARALFIHADQIGPEGVKKLRELKMQLDAAIQKAEHSGGEIIV